MRPIRLACGVAAALLASACAATGTTTTPGAAPAAQETAAPGYLAVADQALPTGGALNLQVHIDSGAATGYDPQLADVATTWQLLSLSYETLTTIGPDFSVQPLLAEKWDTPSPTEYVFHLRKGVTFSNGREMTADDVVGSLKRLLASKGVWRGQLGPVKSVTKDGDDKVKVTLEQPYTPFLAALANVPAAVLPMKEIDDKSVDPATTLLGTGPYVVDNHRQDVSWTFKRNDKYWSKGKPAADTVNVSIAPEEAARIAALQNGGAALATLGNVDSASMLAGAKDVKVVTQATTDFYYLMLNTLKPGSKLADPKVRQAIAIALDNQQIADVALGGKGKPTAITPAGLPGSCDPAALPSAAKSVDDAKALLAEAGAQNLTFTLSIFSTEPAPAVAQVIQQNLQQAGITVKIEQMDEASWSGKVYGKAPAEFDAAMSWFAGYADPGMVTKWWNPETAGFNVGFMKPDKDLNALIDAAGKEPAGAGRDKALTEVCAKADADAQMIPLVTRPATVAYRTDALSPSLYATEGYGNVLRLVADARVKKSQ
ncbi:peptide/nickel transport system substrate-binding protein [Nonomuraea solani]|uniref:Peptide/nickel transport system substrate-binding protein n=1 Tax=Nonomuraea solani TaxID=1144553 RepID=A0A1H5V3W0_9ACTN|nr:ABC transporter substrate-binding protein [Nonomuraea solani]SEF81438.1 peptide/nickel transport system substrate-binding protein [Nonomuraea solani]